MNYATHLSTKVTPQSEPIPGRDMVANSTGGFVFAVDKWKRLERFLILGCEQGTYYATERKLTLENAQCVQDCLAEDNVRTLWTIAAVSELGRAPKNDPAIFALAIAASLGHAGMALELLPKVCRTGTHLFTFVEAVQALRGWGRALRRGIATWYDSMEAGKLAYQVAKYQQRNGWSHRDLLRLAHPQLADAAHQAVYRWVTCGREAFGAREVKRGQVTKSYPAVFEAYPAFLGAVDAIKEMTDMADVIQLIRDYDLPRECVPTQHLNSPEVWEALLEKMPLTALVRNLAKMTTVGLLKPLSKAVDLVVEKLGDAEYIRMSRLHPLALLLAGTTYASGKGQKGHLTWEPVSVVVDALDAAFYKAFSNVEPAGKRTLLALDVSGSMEGSLIAGTSLTAREASAAMALVTARTEPHYQIVAFTAARKGICTGWDFTEDNGMTTVGISACSRLADVIDKVSNLPFGGTNCSLPMVHALREKWEVDTFVIYTDNETWAGKIHPMQALNEYRRKTGIPARLIVVAMTSVGFSIADPNDAGMLDVVGFDAATPAVMADFSRGDVSCPSNSTNSSTKVTVSCDASGTVQPG